MNSVNSKIVKICTSAVIVFSQSWAFAWEVDFSRRQVEFNKITNSNRLPASVNVEESKSLFGGVFDGSEPTQDIVIMNTEKGFVPDTLRLKSGNSYRVHVVNVNKKEQNVSFVLDAFSEHHNTLFGEKRTFTVAPKAEGIFSFQCPETATQGKLIIFSEGRKPASY